MQWGQRDGERAELEELDHALGRTREALESLSISNRWKGRLLFATAVAQRLFDWHDALPPNERRQYSEAWRPTLDHLWAYAAGNESKFYDISGALGRFYLSPQNHNEGQDGPDDADQPEVAATYYAANCGLHGLTEFAVLAASRAIDAIDAVWFGIDEKRRVNETQAELQRQARDMALLQAADEGQWLQGRPPRELMRRLRGK